MRNYFCSENYRKIVGADSISARCKPNILGKFSVGDGFPVPNREAIFGVLILILNQPIDKLSAIISSFCVKLPCQATACLRSLSLTELILSVDFVYRTIEN